MERALLPVVLHLVICLELLLVPRSGSAQEFDTSFMAKHSFLQPDSLLLKDSFWFPPNPVGAQLTYPKRAEKFTWAGDGAFSYFYGDYWYTAEITLRADHSFVFYAGHEGGCNLTVGRWWEEADSIITLQWDDTLSLHISRDRDFDNKYFHQKRNELFPVWPIRIDHWQFVRREDKLVPIHRV
jgi:hypothetical protein